MQKVGVLQLIWLCEIIGGMILMCQNTTMRIYGARIKRYRVLCSKHIAARSSLVITSCWFATSRLRVPASVRRVYCNHSAYLQSRCLDQCFFRPRCTPCRWDSPKLGKPSLADVRHLMKSTQGFLLKYIPSSLVKTGSKCFYWEACHVYVTAIGRCWHCCPSCIE